MARNLHCASSTLFVTCLVLACCSPCDGRAATGGCHRREAGLWLGRRDAQLHDATGARIATYGDAGGMGPYLVGLRAAGEFFSAAEGRGWGGRLVMALGLARPGLNYLGVQRSFSYFPSVFEAVASYTLVRSERLAVVADFGLHSQRYMVVDGPFVALGYAGPVVGIRGELQAPGAPVHVYIRLACLPYVDIGGESHLLGSRSSYVPGVLGGAGLRYTGLPAVLSCQVDYHRFAASFRGPTFTHSPHSYAHAHLLESTLFLSLNMEKAF